MWQLTHDLGTEGLLEAMGVTVAVGILAITLAVGHPLGLGAPVDGLVRLPGVGTATGETESLEAHGLEGNVAGEDEQISPANLVAILLLDGPEETTGLVEVTVVGPAVEGSRSV